MSAYIEHIHGDRSRVGQKLRGFLYIQRHSEISRRKVESPHRNDSHRDGRSTQMAGCSRYRTVSASDDDPVGSLRDRLFQHLIQGIRLYDPGANFVTGLQEGGFNHLANLVRVVATVVTAGSAVEEKKVT